MHFGVLQVVCYCQFSRQRTENWCIGQYCIVLPNFLHCLFIIYFFLRIRILIICLVHFSNYISSYISNAQKTIEELQMMRYKNPGNVPMTQGSQDSHRVQRDVTAVLPSPSFSTCGSSFEIVT